MKKAKAFSLLEMMIVLAVSGILMVSLSQGSKLLKEAKIQKAVTQISLLRNVCLTSTPIDASSNEIWNHLIQNEEVSENEKQSAVGGVFIFEDGNLILAADQKKNGLLTIATAQKIKNKIDGTIEEHTGIVTIKLGTNYPNHPIHNNEEAYLLEIKL